MAVKRRPKKLPRNPFDPVEMRRRLMLLRQGKLLSEILKDKDRNPR